MKCCRTMYVYLFFSTSAFPGTEYMYPRIDGQIFRLAFLHKFKSFLLKFSVSKGFPERICESLTSDRRLKLRKRFDRVKEERLLLPKQKKDAFRQVDKGPFVTRSC